MTYPGIENDPDAIAANPDRAAVEERRREAEAEVSKYVAAQDIPWGSVHAYFAGEPVNTSTAERYGWLELGYVKLADGRQESAGNETASDRPAPTTADSVLAATAKPGATKKKEGSE